MNWMCVCKLESKGWIWRRRMNDADNRHTCILLADICGICLYGCNTAENVSVRWRLGLYVCRIWEMCLFSHNLFMTTYVHCAYIHRRHKHLPRLVHIFSFFIVPHFSVHPKLYFTFVFGVLWLLVYCAQTCTSHVRRARYEIFSAILLCFVKILAIYWHIWSFSFAPGANLRFSRTCYEIFARGPHKTTKDLNFMVKWLNGNYQILFGECNPGTLTHIFTVFTILCTSVVSLSLSFLYFFFYDFFFFILIHSHLEYIYPFFSAINVIETQNKIVKIKKNTFSFAFFIAKINYLLGIICLVKWHCVFFVCGIAILFVVGL